MSLERGTAIEMIVENWLTGLYRVNTFLMVINVHRYNRPPLSSILRTLEECVSLHPKRLKIIKLSKVNIMMDSIVMIESAFLPIFF